MSMHTTLRSNSQHSKYIWFIRLLIQIHNFRKILIILRNNLSDSNHSLKFIQGPPNTFFLENPLKKLLNIFSNFFFTQSFRLIIENNFIQMAASAGCVAHSAVLLKLNVANIQLFNFCEQKFIQHGPIMIAIDCNGLSLLIFEKMVVTRFGCVGFSMYACVFSVSQMLQFFLFTYPPRSKWASSEKMIFFFFAKIGIFCKSIAGPLPRVVQPYTQPYSFDGRIKLIVC